MTSINPKVVICGSFKEIEGIKRIRSLIESILFIEYGYCLVSRNIPSFVSGTYVYPTDQHIEDSQPLIDIHHHGKGEETQESYELRYKMMEAYFKAIDSCDLVFVYNLKDGKEYIGSGTMMEIGYAHARNKAIWFLLKPTDDNILSMFKGRPSYLLETVPDAKGSN